MLGHRELSFEDYSAMLRRRIWVILAPMVVIPAVSYLISLKIPERFTSITLVLVEQQKVPDAYVRPVITEELQNRLTTMQEQILSRTRLQPLIERFGLFNEKGLVMEERVEMMRKAVMVTPIREEVASRTGGLPGFYISFSANNARTAQQVCQEILSLFIQENIHAREQRSQGTTDFLKSQLEEAKRKLDEQDSKLAEFKQKYIGQLPGQEQGNMTMITTLSAQLDATTQAASRAQQDRTFAESLLAQQLAQWKDAQATNSPTDLDQQMRQLQAQLTQLQARYTSDHPDVVKVKSAIAQLKKRQEENSAKPPEPVKATAVEPPGIQQLRLQIHQLEVFAKEKAAEQQRLEGQLRMYQGRVQLSPIVEEQFKILTRDYTMALQFYNELLSKKTQSEMATNLEQRQQGEQFQVMDPPNLPEKPTFPDRPMIAAAGLAGGLALGFGIAYLLEMKDKAMRTESDVTYYLELPTLAMLPSHEGAHAKPLQRQKSRWKPFSRARVKARAEVARHV